MSDKKITDSFLKMSFKESDKSEDENEDENGQEDIEAMKATIRAQQKKLSAAQNRARKAEKAETKPIVSLSKISSKMAGIRASREPNNCCAPLCPFQVFR